MLNDSQCHLPRAWRQGRKERTQQTINCCYVNSGTRCEAVAHGVGGGHAAQASVQGRFQFKRESLPVAVSARILQPQAQRSLPVLFSEVEVDTAFFTCDQGCRSTQLASTYLGPQDVSGGGVCHIVLPELARPSPWEALPFSPGRWCRLLSRTSPFHSDRALPVN